MRQAQRDRTKKKPPTSPIPNPLSGDNDLAAEDLDVLGDLLEQELADDDQASALVEDDGRLASEDDLFADLIEYVASTDSTERPDEELQDGGYDLDDLDEGWVEEDGGSPEQGADDSEWFSGDELEEFTDDDHGAEGPVEKEEFDFNHDPLEHHDEREDERIGIDEVLGRLGLELPDVSSEELEPLVEVAAGVLLDTIYLGPSDTPIEAVAMCKLGPLAGADGLYTLGADGQLHRGPLPASGENFQVESLSCVGDDIFVGTKSSGAFRTRARSAAWTAINDWFTGGLADDVSSSESIGAGLTVFATQTGSHIRLFGLTAAGQLFASDDRGRSFHGPLTRQRCLAATVVEGTSAVLALVGSRDAPQLLRADFNLAFEPVAVAAELTGPPDTEYKLCACQETYLLVRDLSTAPLLCSVDAGRTWFEASQIHGPTAVAIDPDNPTWLAAAVRERKRDLGLVRISEDGGHTWKTALVTGRDLEEDEVGPPVPLSATRDGTVLSLCIHSDTKRRLLCGTRSGVYQANFVLERASH